MQTRLITICFTTDQKMKECVRFESPFSCINDVVCLHELVYSTDIAWKNTPWRLSMGDIVKFEDNKKVYLMVEDVFTSTFTFSDITSEFQ